MAAPLDAAGSGLIRGVTLMRVQRQRHDATPIWHKFAFSP